MLELFRTNQLVANVLLIFYALLLRFSVFFNPTDWTPGSRGILSDWVYLWVGTNGITANLVAIIVVFFQAILINLIIARYRIANETTLFPGVFYIFLASCLPNFLYLSPALIANTFYILAIGELFDTYKKHSSFGRIFNAGFLIAIGSLFYFSIMLFLLLMLIGLGILRAFKIKERLTLIYGFLSPYILIGVFSFWKNNWLEMWHRQMNNNIGFFDLDIPLVIENYIQLGFFVLLLLFILLSYNSYILKKNIQKQKYINILYWGLLFAGCSLGIQANIALEHFLLFTIPMAILLSFSFLNFRNSTAEGLHFLLLIFLFVLHTKDWWLNTA